MELIFLLLPPLLYSLVRVEDELARPHGEMEVPIFDLVLFAKASVSALLLWPLSLCLLGVDGGALVRCCREAEVLVFEIV
jgi:hypothetical protein